MLESLRATVSPRVSGGSEDNNPSNEVVRIGSGTFGTIYMNPSTPEVYKKCRDASNCHALAEEFRQMKLISEALAASGNTILSPTPIELYGVSDTEFWEDPSLCFPSADSVATCVYSMTRIYPLPSVLRTKLIDLFCSPGLQKNARASLRKGHHLARLLLGRHENVDRTAPQRFFNTYNFPLTRSRAERFGINVGLLSGEMGRLLAQLHMTARNDARDIEIVLGANILPYGPVPLRRQREPRVWVLDFNQVRDFDFTESQIPLLVDAFFANEAYFPRARPSDTLYKIFSEAYNKECDKIGDVAGQLGRKFVDALEKEQVLRDTARKE